MALIRIVIVSLRVFFDEMLSGSGNTLVCDYYVRVNSDLRYWTQEM